MLRIRLTLAATSALLGAGLTLAPSASASQGSAPVSADATAADARVAAAACSYSGGHPTLRSGDSGPAVAHMQCLLNEFWGYNLLEDGHFGMNTHVALSNFQVWCVPGNESGIVGATTWNSLHPDTSSC
ncbi:peptidoglycan-binding domain-containing protein [Streptomyces sp. SID1121]|uniref:peptidoglycan-binding domain-containing protein n=1 Tax=Streptomyces sp. SID1121 TaxID=3425888 RepID=UPI004055D21D